MTFTKWDVVIAVNILGMAVASLIVQPSFLMGLAWLSAILMAGAYIREAQSHRRTLEETRPERYSAPAYHHNVVKGQLLYEAVHDVSIERRTDFEFDGTEMTVR